MTHGPPEIPQQPRTTVADTDFSVRLAAVSDLLRVQSEAEEDGSTARWSSGAAIEAQIAAGSKALLTPALRNASGFSEPETWRCHIWFVCSNGARTVSLLDVRHETFQELEELRDFIRLTKAVKLLIEGYSLNTLY